MHNIAIPYIAIAILEIITKIFLQIQRGSNEMQEKLQMNVS